MPAESSRIMEHLARAFDEPVDSPSHQELANSICLGGDLVAMRYWLGRLVDRNFFRDSDAAVASALKKYLSEIGCEKGREIVSDSQSWHPVAKLLQYKVVSANGSAPIAIPKHIAAIQAFLANPELTNEQLAQVARTTEKQVAKMSDLTVLRRAWSTR